MAEMKMIQKIPIQQIDLTDETFSVNFMPDLNALRSSIEQMGLIQPVLLRETGNGYQIIYGFRRIFIFRELGTLEIASRVLGKAEMDDLKLFSISLHENLTTRGFNAIERSIALNKLVHLFQIDPTVVVKTFLPLFSLEPNEKILNTYLSLARMEDEVKRYVLKEGVSRSNIRRLATFPPDDRTATLPLLSSLKLSENRLKEILTLLEEITKRDGLTMKEITQQPQMKAILSQRELTPSQRSERVKKILMAFRYPTMHQKEKEFEERIKALDLPARVSLLHQPFFEGKGGRITFQFETMEEYRTALSVLSSLQDKREFQMMIKIIE